MPLKIGQLALAAGVRLTTIRFYERRGLLPKPQRTASGYRQYSFAAAKRIRFIKNAQELGFTLEEIASLLDARSDAALDRHIIKSRTADKIRMIEEKISELTQVRQVLLNLHECCPGAGPVDQGCPILDALDNAQGA